MSVSEDLYNVLNNSDSYMNAIAESIKIYYLSQYTWQIKKNSVKYISITNS